MPDKYFELVTVEKRKNHPFVIRFYPISDMCPWSIVHREKEHFFFTADSMLKHIINHNWAGKREVTRIENELDTKIKKLFGLGKKG